MGGLIKKWKKNMDEHIKTIYRVIEERYVKVAWTHKIQECQAGIHLKKENQNRITMAWLNALTATSAVTSLFWNLTAAKDHFSWAPVVLTAVLSIVSSYLTFRFKDQTFATKALANKQYAAKCHDMRNKYESLLADIMSERFTTLKELSAKRDELAEAENRLYSLETAPHTTIKAVEMASKALLINRDSQTEDKEIRAIVPQHLQVL